MTGDGETNMIPKALLKRKKLRVSDLERITLSNGGHNRRDAGVCAMEAAAWLAGREHTDSPVCVSPVIGAFMRDWNDSLRTDEDRDRLLKPLLPAILKTASEDVNLEIRRGWMAIDWLARTMAPAFLELVPSLRSHAAALRELTELTEASWPEAKKTVSAAWSAAESAAWSAAWSAAGSAAWSAAKSAAWSAAESAAESAAKSAAWFAAKSAAWFAAKSAAWFAAKSAAWFAAESAAKSAAKSAAESALKPVVADLQQSAIVLVRRMAALN